MSCLAGSGPALALPNAQLDLVVRTAGELELPAALLDRLRLEPGDLLSLEPGTVSVRLEIYRELLDGDWEGVSPASRAHCFRTFLSRPLTALSTIGRLPIPPEVLALEHGDRLVLQIVQHGPAHELFLFRAGSRGLRE